MENFENLEYRFVSPPVKVPEALQEKWGGEYGCPVLNENRELVGFAEQMPQHEGEVIEAITVNGTLTKIVG